MDATLNDAAAFFRVLGDATRLAVVARLARSDERLIGLSTAIKQPPETVAAALADLQTADWSPHAPAMSTPARCTTISIWSRCSSGISPPVG